MILNDELLAIQRGERGEGLQRVLHTLTVYGDAFDAPRMIKITGDMGHTVIGSGSVTFLPVFDLLDKLIAMGLKSAQSFSADPRPIDDLVPATLPQKLLFKYIFGPQKRMEAQMQALGCAGSDAYSCTCYMPEAANIPKKGDILSWAESSAVVYANSVLGARCNRNSGVIELMSCILGYVPEFDLLTDEGRRADWVIEVRTAVKPDPQVLGSAIGMKVVDRVPYIKGLNKWLGNALDDDARAFFKDMGAASASNGAVGLFHVHELTPEAKEQGESLIREAAPVYVIDDAELERVKSSYPCIWKKPEGEPQLCFMGCPHMSLKQLCDWTDEISQRLHRKGRSRVSIPTVFTAAPPVAAAFGRQFPEKLKNLKNMGIVLSSICPMSYLSNPLTWSTRVVTCSNKLRSYSHARFYGEDELADIITSEVR